ncbi:MAG TPA: hypothetical protein VGL78_02110 [Solirubrobacteraceae bacterium]
MLRRDSAANARISAPTAMRFAALLAAMAVLAGCESNSSPPGPYNVVSNYLSQIAEGNYSNACGMLDTGVRDALIKRMGSRTTCSKLFVQCLPSKATNISRDQAQLLYATIQVATHHHKADVTVAGTAVARAIKRVTLAKERGTWKLTSYGDALRRCPHKAHRLRAGRGSPRPTVG